MDILNPHNTITLPANCRNRFYGIAFDGCFFYLTAPQECSIYKFNQTFAMIGSIRSDKPYNCICYDNTEKCFWMTEKKYIDIIFKLDCRMKEIGMLRVKNCKKACSSIIGLSYDCEKDALLAAYKDHIVEVSKESGGVCVVRDDCEELYTAVLSVAPYYAAVRQDGKRQNLQIFTREGNSIKNFCIPDLYSIKDVVFYPCNQQFQNEFEFILLAEKDGCYQNVLFKIKICDIIFCKCNYDVCRTRCGGEEEKEQCICGVIESIALIETSLSHILNAEGEKMQKAVELANNIDELLAINQSVVKTIINVTQLEHNLYLKLDALNDLFRKPIYNDDEKK